MSLTAPQHPPHRSEATSLSVFRRMVSSSFVPLNVQRNGEGQFHAHLQQVDADGAVFTSVQASEHIIERTPDTIDDGGSGFYKLSLLISGSSILLQDGKELVMGPGDLSVYDTSRPYSLTFSEDFENLIFMLPKDRVSLPLAGVDELTAVALSNENEALAKVFSSYIHEFPTQLLQLPERVRAQLGQTSIDLANTLFSTILDTASGTIDHRQLLLTQVYEYITDHLGSPTLTPGSIAAANYISPRYLHSLFKDTGVTVSAWIRERRLERSRTDLLNPALADRTVASIGQRWGFTNPGHFSRAFKENFGVSPSDLRTQHFGAASHSH